MVAKSTSHSCIADPTKMSGKQQTKVTRMFNCVPKLHQAVHIQVFHTHRLYMNQPSRFIYCHPRIFGNLCQNFILFFFFFSNPSKRTTFRLSLLSLNILTPCFSVSVIMEIFHIAQVCIKAVVSPAKSSGSGDTESRSDHSYLCKAV